MYSIYKTYPSYSLWIRRYSIPVDFTWIWLWKNTIPVLRHTFIFFVQELSQKQGKALSQPIFSKKYYNQTDLIDQSIKRRIMTEEKTTSKVSKPKLGQPSASEESASPYPNMELCQQIHKLVVKAEGTEDGKLQVEVLTQIKEELENPALYESIESKLGVTTGIWSAEDIAAQKETNEKTGKELEAKVEEANESAGDMEVMDARVEVARFAAKSLTEKEALEAYKKLLELPKVSSGKKIDAVMESSRVASFYGDTKKTSESVDKVSLSAAFSDIQRRSVSNDVLYFSWTNWWSDSHAKSQRSFFQFCSCSFYL